MRKFKSKPNTKPLGSILEYVQEVTCLYHVMRANLKDEADIKHQYRSLCIRANTCTLSRPFERCSDVVPPIQFVLDKCTLYYISVYQSSVAEWLRRWANLGVITTTELLGGRGFESHSLHE